MIRYPEDRIGHRIGKYTLERVLGRGGMSEVYFARDDQTGRPAAIKVLQSDLPDNIEADRRLEQEARAISRIDHPNVVEIHGYGKTDDGLPYLVMEFLDGRSLTDLMAAVRPMPTEQLLRVVLQMLEALDCAHRLEIIHRDIKPDNVFLVEGDDGREMVKMLDFGIAKLLGTQPHSLVHTVRGVVLGTPEYLPPEIAMDLTVSPVTDLYAVGVILFEGLTGRLPFLGRGPAELAEHHCFTPPPRLRPLNPAVSLELEQIVLRCLAKDPGDRHPSARALADALQPFARRHDRTSLATEVMVRVESTTELGVVEQHLRRAVERHWQSRPVPPVLLRSLEALDGIDARWAETCDRIDTLSERLSQPTLPVADIAAVLAETNAEDQRLSEHLSRLQERLGAVCKQLEAAGAPARAILDDLARTTLGVDDLQVILEPPALGEVTGYLGSAPSRTAWLEEREMLVDEIARASLRRGRVLEQRAVMEGELLSARAEETALRLRQHAEREAARIERDRLHHQRLMALAQLAVDLALALGATPTA